MQKPPFLMIFLYKRMSFLGARRTYFTKERPEKNDSLSGDAQPEYSPYIKSELKEKSKERKECRPHKQRDDHVVSSSGKPYGIENEPDDHRNGYGTDECHP